MSQKDPYDAWRRNMYLSIITYICSIKLSTNVSSKEHFKTQKALYMMFYYCHTVKILLVSTFLNTIHGLFPFIATQYNSADRLVFCCSHALDGGVAVGGSEHLLSKITKDAHFSFHILR